MKEILLYLMFVVIGIVAALSAHAVIDYCQKRKP